MRIALVCISLRGGGTERIVCRIASHLASGHEVCIITLVPGECFYPIDRRVNLLEPQLNVSRKAKSFRILLQVKHLFLGCRRAQPHVCLVFGEDIAGVACLTARTAGTSQVWTFFRGAPERSIKGINGKLNSLLCRLASRITVQTEIAKRCLSRVYPANRIWVWSNPIEVPETVRKAAAREPVIINVGSIGRLKNQESLLRIFSRLDRHRGWKLIFIGDGPKRAELERQVSGLGLDDKVIFHGEQREIVRYLDRAAIFAFTSLSEGFPNALAEALAAGCACVSYDCPTGPSDLIEHGVNGFLVEPGDETDFARKLQNLIDDQELRARFAKNARKAIRKFECARAMKDLEKRILSDLDRVARSACGS